MEGLEGAFERFGGVPEELLFDQMRAVVLSDDRAAGSGLALYAEFLRFAAHWGFVQRSCWPYRARTKGKVERPIRYIRESFFCGWEFANDNDVNEQAVGWLEGTANLRRHATSGERPVDRDERAVLRPLVIRLAIAAAEAGRRVYYGTPAGLIESLSEAKAAGNLSRRLRVLTHPALLMVDEIGYLPNSQDGAVLFFQLINARHERTSTVPTSNKGLEDWRVVLGEATIEKDGKRVTTRTHVEEQVGRVFQAAGPPNWREHPA